MRGSGSGVIRAGKVLQSNLMNVVFPVLTSSPSRHNTYATSEHHAELAFPKDSGPAEQSTDRKGGYFVDWRFTSTSADNVV